MKIQKDLFYDRFIICNISEVVFITILLQPSSTIARGHTIVKTLKLLKTDNGVGCSKNVLIDIIL